MINFLNHIIEFSVLEFISILLLFVFSFSGFFYLLGYCRSLRNDLQALDYDNLKSEYKKLKLAVKHIDHVILEEEVVDDE